MFNYSTGPADSPTNRTHRQSRQAAVASIAALKQLGHKPSVSVKHQSGRPLASLAKLESLWHQYGWPGEDRYSSRPGIHIVNTCADEYDATLWVVSFGDFAPEHMAVWARHAEDAVNLVVNYAHDQGWKGLVSQDPADWLDEEGLAELQDENGNGFPEGLGYEDPGLYYDSYTLHFCEVR